MVKTCTIISTTDYSDNMGLAIDEFVKRATRITLTRIGFTQIVTQFSMLRFGSKLAEVEWGELLTFINDRKLFTVFFLTPEGTKT